MQFHYLNIFRADTRFLVHCVSRGLCHVIAHQFAHGVCFQSGGEVRGHGLPFDGDGVIQPVLSGVFSAANHRRCRTARGRATLEPGQRAIDVR